MGRRGCWVEVGAEERILVMEELVLRLSFMMDADGRCDGNGVSGSTPPSTTTSALNAAFQFQLQPQLFLHQFVLNVFVLLQELELTSDTFTHYCSLERAGQRLEIGPSRLLLWRFCKMVEPEADG